MAVGTVSGINPDDAWQLISSGTPTAASTSFSFSSISTAYKALMITFKSIAITSGDVNLYARFNSDSTNGNYSGMANGYTNTGYYTTSGIPLTGYAGNVGELNGYIIIRNSNSTSTLKTVTEGASFVTNKYSCVWMNASDAISSIAISPSASSFSGSGTFTLYGIPA